jgi:hypothetical protein
MTESADDADDDEPQSDRQPAELWIGWACVVKTVGSRQ